jgi:hypothetical protein
MYGGNALMVMSISPLSIIESKVWVARIVPENGYPRIITSQARSQGWFVNGTYPEMKCLQRSYIFDQRQKSGGYAREVMNGLLHLRSASWVVVVPIVREGENEWRLTARAKSRVGYPSGHS